MVDKVPVIRYWREVTRPNVRLTRTFIKLVLGPVPSSRVKSPVMPGFEHYVSYIVSSGALNSTHSLTPPPCRYTVPCPYRPFMPLLLGHVRGNSAVGPGGQSSWRVASRTNGRTVK